MAGDHSMMKDGTDGMMTGAEMSKLEAAMGADASKTFVTQMITHHQGAVTMARAQVKDGSNAEAIALANRIISAQEAEIREMQALLAVM